MGRAGGLTLVSQLRPALFEQGVAHGSDSDLRGLFSIVKSMFPVHKRGGGARGGGGVVA